SRRPGRHPGDEGRGTGARPRTCAGRGRRCRARRQHLASGFARARARHSDGARRARRDAPHPRRRAGRGRRRCRRGALARLMREFVTQPIAESALARLRQVGEVDVHPDAMKPIEKAALLAGVRGADILYCLLHDRVDREVIAANPRLRLIASMAITPAGIAVAEATARGIPGTVIPPLVGGAAAAICFGLVLAVARRMIEGDRLVRQGILPGSQSSLLAGAGVCGKVLGLIGGGGRIGRAVARRARGFAMPVLYWGPRRMPESDERELAMTYVE